MEVEHFSHKHPLILEEEQKDRFCYGCSKEILDGHPAYSCSQFGCVFNLHKSCAELPLEIVQDPLHTEHPLTFFATPQYIWECYCDNCEVVIEHFNYHCSLCKFDLCIGCASPVLLNSIKHNSHKHPLIPLMRTALLFCDACGTKHEGFFYTCPTCFQFHSQQLFIHMDCALLPTTLKHSGHDDHILNLSYSIPPDYSSFRQECKICFESLFDKCWTYYCGGCRYFVHVNCATTTKTDKMIKTSQTEPCSETDIPEAIRLPVPEFVSLVSHFIKNTKVEEAEREKSTIELDHSIHEHPLTLFDIQSEDEELCYDSKLSLVNEIKDDEICSGCIQQISNSPYYSCAQCKFFLHKFCAELPTTVQHPFHPQHSLTLIAKLSTPLGLFWCNCCSRLCNGFAYHCGSQMLSVVSCQMLSHMNLTLNTPSN